LSICSIVCCREAKSSIFNGAADFDGLQCLGAL
jgi:hypothetical protein